MNERGGIRSASSRRSQGGAHIIRVFPSRCVGPIGPAVLLILCVCVVQCALGWWCCAAWLGEVYLLHSLNPYQVPGTWYVIFRAEMTVYIYELMRGLGDSALCLVS